MFKLKVEKYIVTNSNLYTIIKELELKNPAQYSDFSFSYEIIIERGGIVTKFNFENDEMILNCNPNASTGMIDSNPSNGSSCITWEDSCDELRSVTLCVSKYGDGNGGSISTYIKCNTTEINEFKNVLSMMKTIISYFNGKSLY
jgi:hypothetical protein